jgi:glutathione S-transferase
MITAYGLKWVPEFARGFVRDIRVRWALEEIGQPYAMRLIDSTEIKTPGYRALQPFSQVPAYQEDDLVLFESGAIVLHIARKSNALMPADEGGRARATAWVIAALNSIEPFTMGLADADVLHADKPWAAPARPVHMDRVQRRLADLAEHLWSRTWLDDRFTCGDLVMADALRGISQADLVTDHPVLGPYLARCTERPAFQRALAAQLASFDNRERATA